MSRIRPVRLPRPRRPYSKDYLNAHLPRPRDLWTRAIHRTSKSLSHPPAGRYKRWRWLPGSPYSITERRIPELIPVLGSQPAGDVSHKPGGRLPLLSAKTAVTPATLKRAHYAKLYPQNGERIVTIDSVTSFDSMYCRAHYFFAPRGRATE